MKKMWLVCLAMVLLVLFATTFVAGQDKFKAEAPKVTYLKTLGHYSLISGGSGTAEKARVNFRASAQFIVKKLAEVSPQGEVGKELAIQLFDTDVLDRAVFYDRPVKKGEIFPWMIYRGGLHIQNVMWIGDDPMQTFAFKVRMGDKEYEFAVPKACGNVCLLEIKDADSFVSSVKPESEKIVPKRSAPLVLEEPEPVRDFSWIHTECQPNLKLKFGYTPGQIDVLGPDFVLNDQRMLQNYLPLPSYFYFCEDDDSGWLYSPERYLNYIPGDRLWLTKSRMASVKQSGKAFTAGLELRLWKNLWLSADYFQSRKTRLNIQENLEDLEVKMLEYLGYYPISSTYVHYLKFGRRIINHRASITGFSRELDLTLKWLLETGRISISPVIGVACRQFSQERKEDYFISFLYPWKDKVVSLSEVHGEDKFRHYDYIVVAGLSGELRVLKPLALAVDVWYRKFPDQAAHFQSLFNGTDWSFHSNPWRVTASLKLVI